MSRRTAAILIVAISIVFALVMFVTDIDATWVIVVWLVPFLGLTALIDRDK